MSYQIERSLDGSTSAIVTESQCLKVGEGVLRRITTTATSTGTLVVFDGTEASAVAVGTLTSSGAMTPASHGQTELTSTGAMVAGTHAVSVLTGDAVVEGNVVVIGDKTYTARLVPAQAYDVALGANTEEFLANLKAVINGTHTPTQGWVTTPANTQVVAVTSDATTLTVRGRVPGISLNSVTTTGTALRTVWADTTLGGGTGASDAGVTTAAATVTIGDKTYTVVDELSETYGAAPIAYQVKKGAAEANMLDNLKLAINGTASGLGTLFSTGTIAHPYFIATTNSDTVQKIEARTVGGDDYTTAINALATTETMANTAWADSTFGGGTGNSNPAVTTSAATMTIGNRTYTFVAELSETSGATAVADQILHGAAATNALDNMKSAINGTGAIGTLYSTGTIPHSQVIATTNSATAQVVQSRLTGASQNAIATTDTLGNYAWGAATLASGTGATGKMILNTYTPAAGSNIDLGNIEFEYGLYVTVGGTSISATFTYK